MSFIDFCQFPIILHSNEITLTNKENADDFLTYLSSVLPDALPQRFENRVKGLDTVRCRSFSQRSDSEGTDGPHLLLLIHQSCGVANIVSVCTNSTAKMIFSIFKHN